MGSSSGRLHVLEAWRREGCLGYCSLASYRSCRHVADTERMRLAKTTLMAAGTFVMVGVLAGCGSAPEPEAARTIVQSAVPEASLSFDGAPEINGHEWDGVDIGVWTGVMVADGDAIGEADALQARLEKAGYTVEDRQCGVLLLEQTPLGRVDEVAKPSLGAAMSGDEDTCWVMWTQMSADGVSRAGQVVFTSRSVTTGDGVLTPGDGQVVVMAGSPSDPVPAAAG